MILLEELQSGIVNSGNILNDDEAMLRRAANLNQIQASERAKYVTLVFRTCSTGQWTWGGKENASVSCVPL